MYEFTTSERTVGIAAEYETKALLYLMSYRKDSADIDTFIIDCFNDVTGSDNDLRKLWDVQSKGDKNLSPKLIGKYLVTLFQNFVSNIDFEHYILLVRDIHKDYLHKEKVAFGFDNFDDDRQTRIKNGLKQEYERRNKKAADDIAVDYFLTKVMFYCAKDKKQEFVKKIIKFKSKIHFQDTLLEAIFDEIRNEQAKLKTIDVFGKKISDPQEVLAYKKHLSRTNIETLVVNRFIGMELFNDNTVPFEFMDIIRGLDKEDVKDIIQDCNADIGRTLFNKNNGYAFWYLLEEILTMVKKNPHLDAQQIYAIKPLRIPYTMNEMSVKYLISLIIGGL